MFAHDIKVVFASLALACSIPIFCFNFKIDEETNREKGLSGKWVVDSSWSYARESLTEGEGNFYVEVDGFKNMWFSFDTENCRTSDSAGESYDFEPQRVSGFRGIRFSTKSDNDLEISALLMLDGDRLLMLKHYSRDLPSSFYLEDYRDTKGALLQLRRAGVSLNR